MVDLGAVNVWLLLSTVFFVISMVIPEYRLRQEYDYNDKTISHYLNSPVQQAGFVVMSVAMGYFSWLHVGTSIIGSITSAVVSVGLLGILISELIKDRMTVDQELWRDVHNGITAVTLVSGIGFTIGMSDTLAMLSLAIAYPAMSALVYVLVPGKVAVYEKVCVALLVWWILAYAIGAR